MQKNLFTNCEEVLFAFCLISGPLGRFIYFEKASEIPFKMLFLNLEF